MQSRFEAITKLLKDNFCLDDFSPEQIVEISNCSTPQLFEKMMANNQILKQNFEDELTKILLSQPEDTQNHIRSNAYFKDIFQYQDLIKIAEKVTHIQGSFSYKHIKRIELKLFCLLHSQLLSRNGLDEYEDIDLRQQINLLKQSIKRESKQSRSFDQTFMKIAKTQNIQSLYTIFEEFKKEMMIINNDQLVNLIDKSKEAQKKVQNKNGIVFIGTTGAGKTTAILSLLGHQIVTKKWQGIIWATPKYLLNIQGIKNLVACPSSKSITRNVTAIELPKQKGQIRKQKIYFIDTPGFNDTQGSIMDLSNAFGTSQAIKSLSKAKFVILLSGRDLGSKYQGLVQITQILNQLFPHYEKVKNSVILFFNRYDRGDMECISEMIVKVWENLPESSQSNQNLEYIFNDFKEKASKKETHFNFDPIDKNKSYSQAINRAISQYPWVQRLQDVFSVSYGEKAKQDIEKQVTNLKDYCLYYFKVEEVQIVKYYIQQLLQLREILGKDKAPEMVSNSFKIIKTSMLEQISKKYQNISKQFLKGIDFLSLSQKDINEYFKDIKGLDIYLTLQEYIDITNIKDKLNTDVNNKINLIVSEAKKEIDKMNEKSILCLSLLLKAFKRSDCFEQICSVFDLKIKQKIEIYKGKIQISDFQESIQFYESSKFLTNLYSIFTGKKEEIEKKFLIDDIIQTEIKQQHSSISSFVQNFADCSVEKFKEIQRVSQFFTKLEISLKFLKAISNYQQVLQLALEFKCFITKNAEQNLLQCEEYLSGKQNLSSAMVIKINKFYGQISQMKQIPHLKTLVTNKSRTIDHKISFCLSNEKKVLEGFIEQIKRDKINFTEIKREVIHLDQSALRIERVLQFQSNTQEITLDDVANKIKYFFEDVLSKVESMSKSKKNIFDEKHNEFEKLGQIVEMLEAFNLQQKKQRQSKLLQNKDLITIYDKIKQKSQNIFTNKFSEIQKITNKLIEKGKQKQENQLLKYRNIKFKQIELCLNFIELGKKIFNSISQKYNKFQNAQQKLIQQIKKLEKEYMKAIELLFRKLKDKSNQDFSQAVKQLKKKILILQEIKRNYHLLEKLLEPQSQSYIQEELNHQISEIFKFHKKLINQCSQLSNPVNQISSLIQRCQTLSTLDCFTDEIFNFRIGQDRIRTRDIVSEYFNFRRLEDEIQIKIQKFTKSLDNKFKFALEMKNYDDVLNILESMSCNQKELFDESESQFCKVVQKQISQIFNKKKKEYESQHHLEFIIQKLGELNKIKKVISSNQKMRTKNILQLQSNITDTMKSLSSDIKSYYEKFVEQIQIEIQQRRICQANEKMLSFNKRKSILMCDQIDDKIDFKKWNKLEENVKGIIKNFEGKYILNSSPDLTKFREQYKQFFPDNMSSGQFYFLKNKIEVAIDDLIQKQEKEIDLKDSFNKSDLTQIKEFVNQLPEYFKSKIQCQNLQNLARQKHQKWQKEKIALNTQAQKLTIFQNRALNKKVINCFSDKQLNKNTLYILTTNLTNQLQKLIQGWQKDFNQFVQRVVESKQLQSLKKCQAEKGLEEICHFYLMKSVEIENQMVQLFFKSVHKIQQITIQPKYEFLKDEQLKVKIENKIDNLLQSLFLLENKYEPTSNLKQSIKERLQQYVSCLIKCHRKNVNLINNMKTCLDFSQDDSKIKQQITQIKYVCIIQYFLLGFVKKGETVGSSNQYVHQIFTMIRQYQKDLKIEKYKTIIKDQIMPKYEQCLNFSLQSKTVYSMSENDLKKELKEYDSCNLYMGTHLVHLLDSVGKNIQEHKIAKISQHNKKIQQQADQMAKQIMKFADQPSIDDKKIEDIKKSLLIIKLFSQIYKKIKQTESDFTERISKYHNNKYKQIQDLLNKLKQKTEIHQKTNQINKNQVFWTLKKREDEIKAAFRTKFEKIHKKYEAQTKDLSEQEKLKTKNIYEADVHTQNNLEKEQMEKIKSDAQNQLNETQNKHFQEIKDDFKQITQQYIIMTTITNNFTSNKELINKNKKIIDSIYRIGRKKWLQIFVNCLNDVGSTTAKIIIYENPELNRLTQNHFLKNIQSLTIDQLICKMTQCNATMSEDFYKKIKRVYQLCKTKYDQWLTDYKNNKNKIKDNLIQFLKQKSPNFSYQNQNQVNLKIVASILALWTIIQSIQQDGEIIYSFSPHPVQIITLILLLGLVDMKQCEGYKNRFAEVKTGEGKSLILAVTAVYFTLDKYSVDCVCYSEHLSSRDKTHFQQLFSLLGVESRINYCTFNDLTETLLEKGEIKLREQCINLSKKKVHQNGFFGKIISAITPDKFVYENKILLLDEADVFFMNEFYGNTYTPSFQLRSEHIKNLYSLIWEKRNELNKVANQIQNSKQFLKIVDQFPQYAQLIKNHLPHMFQAAENFKHSYLTEDDRILYRDQDGYTDKISYGYKTIFAYFYQFGRKTISKLPHEVSSLTLSVCQISYAELPQIFPWIVGVTGTLSSLAECKKRVMNQKYNINENYIIPSIYKESKRDDKGYCIVQTQKQFQQVVKNLKPYHENNRPILIFFANLENLNKFYHSKIFKPYQDQTAILYERHNTQQRKERIMRATTKGKITLITSSFGRGTDFIIYEDQVINKGGVHIIITYLPQDKSQQVQLLGRVGRQGNPGSSIFILSTQQTTSKLGYSYQYLTKQNSSKIQEVLVKIRQRQSNDKQIQLSLQINTCLKKHNESLKLLNEIKNHQDENAFQKIIKMNLLPVINTKKKPVKTIIALDATCSMDKAIAATKSSLSQSFDRVYKILQSNKVQSGFLIQIVLYRNYNVQENQLIETSPFQSTAKTLVNFVQNVELRGGMGSQALEVVFDYCLKVQDLKQIIVVTDAKPNTQQEIMQKRKHEVGEIKFYWSKTQNFKQPIKLQKVQAEMKKKGIIVNALPIGTRLLQFYTKLCIQNGGKCQLFDPTHKDHVDTMTNFIATSILSKLGEDQKVGDKLVESYKKTYNK